MSVAFGYHPVCFALEMNLLYFTYCSSFLLYLGLVVLMILLLLLHLFLFFLIYFSGETRKFVLITKNMSKMTSYPIVPERKQKQYTMCVSTQNMEKQVLQKIKLTPKFSFLILQKTFLNKRPLS